MQQKMIIVALFAGSAIAVPWGPGGRWGPPQDMTEESTPTGFPEGGFQGGPSMDMPTDAFTGTPTQFPTGAFTGTPTQFPTGAFTGAVSRFPSGAFSNVPSAAPSAATSDFPSGDDFSSSDDIEAPGPTSTTSSMVFFGSLDNSMTAKSGGSGFKTKPSGPTVTAEPSALNSQANGQFPTGGNSQTAAPKYTQTSSAAKSSATGTGGTGGTSSSGNAYQDMVVNHHNIHRANHSAPDLQWDASLASTANKIAQSCNFAHNTQMDGGGYGQNIQAGASADDVWQAITESFYNGEVNAFSGLYGQANPSNFEDWGHFSQLVWKSTTSVGCATVHCPNGVTNGVGTKDFTVCNYKPAGNFANDYAKNIAKSLGRPTVDTAQVSS